MWRNEWCGQWQAAIRRVLEGVWVKCCCWVIKEDLTLVVFTHLVLSCPCQLCVTWRMWVKHSIWELLIYVFKTVAGFLFRTSPVNVFLALLVTYVKICCSLYSLLFYVNWDSNIEYKPHIFPCLYISFSIFIFSINEEIWCFPRYNKVPVYSMKYSFHCLLIIKMRKLQWVQMVVWAI